MDYPLTLICGLQEQLDERIIRERKLNENELLPYKLTAFAVEICELQNELPETFKFWSNKKNNLKRALEEYVDGLCFLVSIGLELKRDMNRMLVIMKPDSDDITDLINELLGHITFMRKCQRNELVDGVYYDLLFEGYMNLGELIGFSWSQIERAYFEKNQINNKRQDEGY